MRPTRAERASGADGFYVSPAGVPARRLRAVSNPTCPTSAKQHGEVAPIPGTVIFDGAEAQKGYALNKMCYSFNRAENRLAFVQNEEAHCRAYGLTAEQAVYFSTHEEADLKEHADGVMGHGSFRRLVLRRLLEDGMVEVRPGYSLEYCGLTAVDLHGAILQAALDRAAQ